MRVLVSLYLWFVGGLYFLFFLVSALAFSYVLPEKKYDPLLKKMLRILFRLMFIRVEISGRENLEPGKTYLFMSNHVSLFDIPLLGGYVPGIVRGIEALRQHRWPLYGFVVGRLGNIPIDRTDVHRSVSSIRKTIRTIPNHRSLVILPEGHRTLDGNLKPFKKLPFFLAKQLGKDLVPVGLSGLFSLKRKGSWLIRPGRIRISFGPVISAHEIEMFSVDELKELVRQRIDGLTGFK